MHIPKSLSVVFILFFFLVAAKPLRYEARQGCGLGFTTNLVKAVDQNLFTLTITASGGRPPYHFLLLDNKNNLMSKNFSNNVFTGLTTGQYRCIVADANDCNKEQAIEVK